MRSVVDERMLRELSKISTHCHQGRPSTRIGWRQSTQAFGIKSEHLNFWKRVIGNILPTWHTLSQTLLGILCAPTRGTLTCCVGWGCHSEEFEDWGVCVKPLNSGAPGEIRTPDLLLQREPQQ